MVLINYSKYLKPFSRELRCNQTNCELALWQKIRKKQILNIQFNRQKPIGPYILDFYSNNPKIAIELDGGQHFLPEQQQSDKNRDFYLKSLGITVLRFDNQSLLSNLEGVLQVIYDTVQKME